jgi:hypothetical protein
MNSGSVIQIPAVIDTSALQLQLAVLTGWLDRQGRDVLRISLKRAVSCAGSCGADGCSSPMTNGAGLPCGRTGWAVAVARSHDYHPRCAPAVAPAAHRAEMDVRDRHRAVGAWSRRSGACPRRFAFDIEKIVT